MLELRFWSYLVPEKCGMWLKSLESNNRCKNVLISFMSVVVAQLLSCVRLFETPWTAAHQASLSFVISSNLLKLMSVESGMPSNQHTLCHPLLWPSIFPSIRVFSNFLMSQFFTSGGQSIGASASSEYSGLLSFRIDWFDLLNALHWERVWGRIQLFLQMTTR